MIIFLIVFMNVEDNEYAKVLCIGFTWNFFLAQKKQNRSFSYFLHDFRQLGLLKSLYIFWLLYKQTERKENLAWNKSRYFFSKFSQIYSVSVEPWIIRSTE